MASSPRGPRAEQLQPLLAAAAQALRDGRPAQALGPLREAAMLRPSDASIHHDLGLASLETGALPQAIAAFRRAVSIAPRYADAYFRMGVALETLGDRGSAVVAYHHATELQPALAEAWFRAGALVYTMGHRDEAIGCFRRAAASGSKTRFDRLGAARALLIEDRTVEAERLLRRILTADSADAMAQDLLGNLLAEAGRFEEARACFARAIHLAPRMAGSYYDLVRCRPIAPGEDDLVARMEAALSTPGLDAESQLRVHLALGKAADDLGRHAEAMGHFDAADALRPASAAFDGAAASSSDAPPTRSPARLHRATAIPRRS